MEYKKITSFEDCVNATGNYGTLYNIIQYLCNEDILDFDDIRMDDYYYELHWEKINKILKKLKINLSETNELETLEDFTHKIELDDKNYEYKLIQFITKHIWNITKED